MRYAIYFTPAPDTPLARSAARWLGRDVVTGQALPPHPVGTLSAAECAFHTASARRYGFHATLKAPFRLADEFTEDELFTAFDAFAAATGPAWIERLVLRRIAGFFALVPGTDSPDVDRLAASAVTHFEPFRAPLTEAEIERRNPDRLGADEFRYLHRWGYPYVFDRFRFHMTLSGRVTDAEVPRLEDAITERFAEHLERPLAVDMLALFVEPEPGAPFYVERHAALGVQTRRMTA